jgi:uncharacterized protein YutE (UPF0331/DUF86 family)
VLELAIDLYQKGTEKANKFSVLFCDHAIELILKEKLLTMGESIYIKGGRTIEFFDALNFLENNKGVKIQEHADLEMIHDLRNTIQHRGATVSKHEAEYYLKKVYDFMKRFLREELKLELKDILERRYYDILEQGIDKTEKIIEINSKHESTPLSVADFSSVPLVEYRNLEIKLNQVARNLNLELPKGRYLGPSNIVRELVSNGNLPKEAIYHFDKIRNIRNKVAHTEEQLTDDEIEIFTLATDKFKSHLENITTQRK